MIPQNELGVIVVFAQLASQVGFEILEIGAAFPDAKVRKDGVEYRAEFEYAASNFKTHKHDIRKCDLIICWENDYPDCILPVIALSAGDIVKIDLSLPTAEQREIDYWRGRAGLAEKKLKLLKHIPEAPIRVPKSEWRKQAIEILRKNPYISGAELGRTLGASQRTGQNILNELEQAGVIHRNGQGIEVLQ